jgi:hypothetical protein
VRAELLALFEVLADRVEHVSAPLATHPDVPLRVHARYSRLEILAAFGVNDGDRAKVAPWQTGVYWAEGAKADLLAFTLDKTSGQFSPTTRYRESGSHSLGKPVGHARGERDGAAVPEARAGRVGDHAVRAAEER